MNTEDLFISPYLPSHVRWRAHQAGIRGNTGGWIQLPCGVALQGWFEVWTWAREAVRYVPWNLREILEGNRVGTPTLRRTDAQELAAGLLSPMPACWRD